MNAESEDAIVKKVTGVSKMAECRDHTEVQPPEGSCLRISVPLGAERTADLQGDRLQVLELFAARLWSFDRLEGRWLYLRHSETILRVRFWPDPRVEMSLSGNAWADVSYLGDALLAQSGFFLAAEGHGICLVGYRPLADYLGVIDGAQGDRLPMVDFECEPSDAGLVLVNGRRQLCFHFDLLARETDRAWKTARALDFAVACIPRAVRRRLPYFGWSPWDLLVTAYKHRAVADLMVSNPMLLTLWLRRVEGNFSLFECEVVSHLRLKQREQLAMCAEVPVSQTAVKILRKVPLEEMHHIPVGVELHLASGGFSKEVIRHLRHRSVVTAFEVYLAVAGNLIQIIPEVDVGDSTRLARLIQAALRRLPRPAGLKLPLCLSTILRELERLEAVVYVPPSLLHWRCSLPFECPKGWEHLDTLDAVVSEGLAQRNCLVQPVPYLKVGVFLFRVNDPARATVCVVEKGSHLFEVSECKGYRNRALEPELLEEIRSSLRKALASPVETAA